MARTMNRRPVVKINLDATGEPRRRPDDLAAEEPLEIRVGRKPLAVTMRTPGQDIDLAMGFLLTEGIIGDAADVVTAQLCAGTDTPNTYNVVDVVLGADVPPPATDPSRNFYTTSSCGVCGKASIDAIRTRSRFDVAGDPLSIPARTLAEMPDRLQGRLPLTGHVLLVSGRASFELTQKAWMAGLPLLAAVSAPSTLAAELAEEAGMTLVGFLRGATMNVYTATERVTV
jgi:FdhD protein